MTQPTDRPGIDQLTSDMLDQLYREIDTLRAVCESNKQAYVGAVKHAWQVEAARDTWAAEAAEQTLRAERAEATLTAVRKLIDHPMQTFEAFGHPAISVRPIRNLLDQHGQTPA